jgi:hypothetical protein
MSRSSIWNAALVVNLVFSLLLALGLAVMAVSGTVTERVAPRLHLASNEDSKSTAADVATLESRVSDAEAQLSDLSSNDVAGALDDLDSRLSDLEREVGSSSELNSLSSRVDDVEAKLEDACSSVTRATTQSIGSDAFYVFLDLQQALC